MANVTCLTHHGFSFTEMAQRVWDEGRSSVSARSVNPPRSGTPAAARWRRALDATLVLETIR